MNTERLEPPRVCRRLVSVILAIAGWKTGSLDIVPPTLRAATPERGGRYHGFVAYFVGVRHGCATNRMGLIAAAIALMTGVDIARALSMHQRSAARRTPMTNPCSTAAPIVARVDGYVDAQIFGEQPS